MRKRNPPFPTPKYQIDDVVWLGSTTTQREKWPCPDCLGAQVWDVTSPAGVAMKMDCPRCCREHYGNTLSLDKYVSVPSTRQLTIGSVRVDTYADNPVTYMCRETGVGSGNVWDEGRLFLTEQEAIASVDAQLVEEQAKLDARAAELGQLDYISQSTFNVQERDIRTRIRHEFDAQRCECTRQDDV